MTERIGSHTVHKWLLKNGLWVPIIIDDFGIETEVVWAPQAGSQDAFLSCPTQEVLYSGTRGPGKTDALLMDFAQHVGTGFGANWVGVLFRHTHPELRDVIEKSKRWYKQIFQGATYNEIKFFWEWTSGERLYFSHFNTLSDYDKYHGHQYPWIGWEELTSWNAPDCYKSVFSLLRSPVPGIPRKIRSTTNPHGVGHNWVKQRFRITTVSPDVVAGPLINDARDDAGNLEPPRQVIFGFLEENKILLKSDPKYIDNLKQSARSEAQLQAWLYGSWDIVAGGMLDDIWHGYKDTIIVKGFDIPPHWIIYRAYDHGSSKPFSAGWYAISDGSDVMVNGKARATVRGDLFRVREWYGWRNGRANEGMRMLVTDISRGMIEREIKWGWRSPDGRWCRVKRGPADTSIFDENNGVCIADDFERPVYINGIKHRGIVWERADKGPGSREQGWEQLRRRLKATKRVEGEIREVPGLFICEECQQWLRTVPVLPRDEKKVDDVDTDAEDHCGDETRYMLRYEPRTFKSGRTI